MYGRELGRRRRRLREDAEALGVPAPPELQTGDGD
jgi:hypothetical protein